MKEVIVYTQNQCRPCGDLKAFLDNNGVPYTLKNISEDAKAKEEVIALGAMTTPVTVVGLDAFFGFDHKIGQSIIQAISE